DLVVRFWSSDGAERAGRGSAAPGASGDSLRAIIEREGLGQVSDTGAIDALVAQILAANEKTAADYRAGKTKVLGFLVGQVMKQSRGTANPTLAEERLRAALDG
ncbi:MAG: hypothetical protein IAI49_15810, partial [Candidatus Eremiobacteraeota bacterium]|nr:hypothetical protein [Candidatus Eremiobacteraeota bacterium]